MLESALWTAWHDISEGLRQGGPNRGEWRVRNWSLLSGDQQQNPRKQHRDASGKGQVVIKWFFTRGWWACNRLPWAVGMVPSCKSSRSISVVLSDIGFEFWMVLCGSGSWTPWSIWVLSNSNILWFQNIYCTLFWLLFSYLFNVNGGELLAASWFGF